MWITLAEAKRLWIIVPKSIKDDGRLKYWTESNISHKWMKFRSKLEVGRYDFLEMCLRLSLIQSFAYEEEKFVLLEGYSYNGKVYKWITYTPDFKVVLSDGSVVYEDTKSCATAENSTYRVKMKLFIRQHVLDFPWRDFKEIYSADEKYF